MRGSRILSLSNSPKDTLYVVSLNERLETSAMQELQSLLTAIKPFCICVSVSVFRVVCASVRVPCPFCFKKLQLQLQRASRSPARSPAQPCAGAVNHRLRHRPRGAPFVTV